MFVGLLGPLEVDGSEPDELAPKHRRVLAVLALSPGAVVGHGFIERVLWEGDPPPTARKIIQQGVSAIRKSFGADAVRTSENGYALGLEEDSVDACVFEREAQRARILLDQGKPWAAADMLASALSLWRGDAVPELRDTSEGSAAGRRLDEERLAAEEDLADARLACGEHGDIVGTLREAVEAEPLRERRWAQLMLALYRGGRQAEALRSYQELRDYLGRELGIEPSAELTTLEESIVLSSAELHAPIGARHEVGVDYAESEHSQHLPRGLSSFVGRESELAKIESSVGRHRLITVTGPAGCGKTRLALEVGARLVDRGESVWLVDLSPLRDPSQVQPTISQVLGVHESPPRPLLESLTREIGDRSMILLIDNCEHVVDEAAKTVEVLLQSCDNVGILATSREPLAISGERVERIGPLSLPDPGSPTDPESLTRSEAVQLFVDRASAHDASFSIDESTAPSVRSICERLDGIPLAIELAAARTRSMSVDEVALRLSDRFGLLTQGSRTAQARQRTLESAIAWSFDMLTPGEQSLLTTLSVFVGAFTLEAAESVGATGGTPPDEVALLVAGLVDRSLLQFERARSVRFRLLETIREFAARKLGSQEAKVALPAAERHARYFVSRWSEFNPVDDSEIARTMWQSLPDEKGDLIAALGTCLRHDQLSDADAAFGRALMNALMASGDLKLMGETVDQLASRVDELRSADLRIQILRQRGAGLYSRGRVEESIVVFRQCLAECRGAGAEEETARTLYYLVLESATMEPGASRDELRQEILHDCTNLRDSGGDPLAIAFAKFARDLLIHLDDVDASCDDIGDALSFFVTEGRTSLAWVVRQTYGSLEAYAGNLGRARELTAACIEELEEHSAVGRHLSAQMTMALIDAMDGDACGAARACADALRRMIDTDMPTAFPECAVTAGFVLERLGEPERAAAFYGVVAALVEDSPRGLWPFERHLFDKGRANIRASVGSEEAEEIEKEGCNAGLSAVAASVLPILDELALQTQVT